MSANVYVKKYRRPTWHIASYEPHGYGTWTLCGVPFHAGDGLVSRQAPATLCARCERSDARIREGRRLMTPQHTREA